MPSPRPLTRPSRHRKQAAAQSPRHRAVTAAAIFALTSFASGAFAQAFTPGDLILSRVEYLGDPTIFNNPNVGGINGAIFLDEFAPVAFSPRVSTLALPNSATSNTGITTSFSSKSEGALALSVDGRYLTYMGYQAAVGSQGVSNSYTLANHPAANSGPFYNRDVARIGANGVVDVSTVLGDAYSGDNPRAVISVDGSQVYMVGNANKDANTIGTIGARYATVGASSSVKLGTANPGNAKADNFRALTIFNGNLYVAKGSGSNGNNGVFQVGSGLPTTASSSQNTVELPGFPTGTDTIHPFGLFFANATTLYVADEGPGSLSASPLAGLQKWVLTNGEWVREYTLQSGLDLDVNKTVAGYAAPTATTGLRNLTGKVDGDKVTLYGITAQFSSISGGEPDPTSLVSITDSLDATSLPGSEAFTTLETSGPGEVFRGLAFAPTPEPGAVTLLAAGVVLFGAGIGARRSRRR